MKQNSTSDKTTAAKLPELQKLSQFSTYEEVKDCGQRNFSTKWVITNKKGQTKAMLVVPGLKKNLLCLGNVPR